MIHWPLPTLYGGDFVSTWHTLEEFYRDGRARSIGLSNFQVAHVRRVVDEGDVVPAGNQIEVHPYLCNEEVRAANAEYGIVTEAWSPLAKGRVLQDPTIVPSAVGSQDPRSGWCCAGTFSAETSSSQVDDTGTHEGELRDLRLRARDRRNSRDQRT